MEFLPIPDTTVIVATHNRPDALRQTLRTVAMQTHRAWVVIVVGDVCDERTQTVMNEFADDPRFLYVNLSNRCREQALPNSAAMAVASTEFVALLNHDDLWLPDHLTVALDRLRACSADLYVGRASGCIDEEISPTEGWRPVFHSASPQERTWSEAFWRSFEYIEPASVWVFRRTLATRVGPWRPAFRLDRTPIQDWFLRAWRSGARIVSDHRITCIKMEVQWRGGANERVYETPVSVHEATVRLLQSLDASGKLVRDAHGNLPGLALSQPWRSYHPPLPGPTERARRFEALMTHPWVGALYRWLGWDAAILFCRLLRAPRGQRFGGFLAARTGEELTAPPPLENVVNDILSAKSRAPHWPGWARVGAAGDDCKEGWT